MKKLTVSVGLLMAICLLAAPVWADTPQNHVIQAPNKVGDVLIYPVWVAFDEGYETKFCVVNTSPRYGTVAKVVIRGWIWSQELLDFFIFLSPNDVWCGTIQYDPDLGTILYSDDDSIQTAPCVFDAENNPIREPLKAIPCALAEEWMGYIEVFNNWSHDYGLPVRIIDKELTLCPDFLALPIAGNEPRDILTGHYEQLFAGVTTAADVPTVLANYNITDKLTLGAETFFGENALNSICEVEAVLSKDQEYKYYYNMEDKYAIHWNTLPTKLTQITPDCNLVPPPPVRGPFHIAWGLERNGFWCFEFTYNYWDWFENDPDPDNPLFSPTPEEERWYKCLEVEPFFTEPPFIRLFDEGWVRWGMGPLGGPTYVTTCDANDITWDVTFSGAPVIDTIWFVGPYGLSILPGAWKDGRVWYDDPAPAVVHLPFYQYYTEQLTFP
jgi:hypothetical protein